MTKPKETQFLTTIFVKGVEKEYQIISYADFRYTANDRALNFFRNKHGAFCHTPLEYNKTVKWPHAIEKDMLVNTNTRI